MRKSLIAFAFLLASHGAAFADACPSFAYGRVLTAAQWQACFDAKQNALNFTPVNQAGDTMTGKLTLPASTTTTAGFKLPAGTAPTSPSDGDIWTTTSGAFVQINGGTLQIGLLPGTVRGAATVDFNSVADTSITITLPSGYTRYLVDKVLISGADASLSGSTAGLFTAASGGGTAIVTASTPVTITASADETNNNAMSMTVNNAGTESYTAGTLYFRIGTALGSAGTATVTILVHPLP